MLPNENMLVSFQWKCLKLPNVNVCDAKKLNSNKTIICGTVHAIHFGTG